MADDIVFRIRAEGTDKFIKDLKQAGVVVEDTGDKVEKENKKMGGSFAKLGKTIGAAFTVTALIRFSKALGKLATDIDATNAKFETVFGDAGRLVEDFAKKNARALGLTVNEFKKASAAIGDLLVPLGFQRQEAAKLSSTLVKLSGDLAKWDTQQRSSSEISEILSKAILGEREQLKTLGINIQEADIKQRLFEKGQSKLTGSALKQAKALATVELIIENTGDAQRSAADDTETLREKQEEVGAIFRQTAQDVAEKLIPAYSKLLDLIVDLATGNETQQIIKNLNDQADIITKQQLEGQKKLVLERQKELKEIEKARKISFGQAKELENDIPKALRRINEIEEKRTEFIRVQRAGTTAEIRAANEEQRILEEKLAAEEKIKRQKEEAAEKLKEQKRLQAELAKIIEKGVQEIRNGNLGLDETIDKIEEINIKLNAGLVESVGEKLSRAIDEQLEEDIEYDGLRIDTSDVERQTDQFWDNLLATSQEAATKEQEILNSTFSTATESLNILGAAFDANAQRRLAAVQARVDAELITEEEGQKQREKILTQQAIADKASALFQIAINTAQAITKAVAQFPFTGGQPFAGIALGIGLAQAALVASQPIPQFAEGTKGRKKAPKGFAWVGEEGPELMQMRGGEKIVTNQDSEELMRLLGGYGIPVQFNTLEKQLYKPMTKMEALVSNSSTPVDINPLIRSNDMNRLSLGKKLDRINDNLIALGTTRKMTKA